MAFHEPTRGLASSKMAVATQSILIMGVGNLLMGDEGVGVHAVRRLEERPWPSGVTLLDGGTGGFHLLSHLGDCDILIMIDATLDDRPPGTVSVIQPRYASDFPRALSAHDIGLKDLIDSAAILGILPEVRLVTISVAAVQPMQMTMSPDVEASLPHVAAAVTNLVSDLRGTSRSSQSPG
jgi:hydrogenase maturation protease